MVMHIALWEQACQECRASDTPKYFAGNWALPVHGCRGHGLEKHGQEGAALLASKLYSLKFALQEPNSVAYKAGVPDTKVSQHTFLS